MLHLLALPPEETALLAQALRLIRPDDAVVFLDAGLSLLEDDALLVQLRQCDCYVWGDTSSGTSAFPCIDAEGVVALSEQHPTSLSWYPETQ